FVCPSIFMPLEQLNSPFVTASARKKRNLVLISKVLQNIANGKADFSEDYMSPFSSFVTRHIDAVHNRFFVDLSILDEEGTSPKIGSAEEPPSFEFDLHDTCMDGLKYLSSYKSRLLEHFKKVKA